MKIKIDMDPVWTWWIVNNDETIERIRSESVPDGEEGIEVDESFVEKYRMIVKEYDIFIAALEALYRRQQGLKPYANEGEVLKKAGLS